MAGFLQRRRSGSSARSFGAAAAGGALLLALLAVPLRPASAQVGSDRYSSIIVDAASGQVLSSANADEPRYPASLTKMMTLYMLFEALRDRRVTLNQYVPVSAWAAGQSPSKLGLVPGSLITVEQALLGLVTKSANDAAAALGELLGGDEERFAQLMTLRARSLGMSRTTFRNASGLPDWSQVTTARDMATLGRRLALDFPVYYQYFSTPNFVFRGRFIPNHDRMLQTYPGADGLKTGWIQASGHNLTTSAVRGGVRLVGVVLGAESSWERDQHMTALLDQGYESMGIAPAYAAIARREPPPPAAVGVAGLRLPQFISSAQAAPVERYAPIPAERPRVQWAGARAYRAASPPPLSAARTAAFIPAEPRALRRASAGAAAAPRRAVPVPAAERVLRARPISASTASAEATTARARPAATQPGRPTRLGGSIGSRVSG